MTNDAAELQSKDCVLPQWNVSPRVRAFVTTRAGGVSDAPYDGGTPGAGGLNLGFSSGDAPDAVKENRRRVLASTGLRNAAWLEQIHGTQVEDAHAVIERLSLGERTRADASVTDRAGVVCVVMTADCLPVLFCDDDGRAVGAAHAGWRGLAGGIVEKTGERVAALAGVPASKLNAFLGPAIGPNAFEVGEAVTRRRPRSVPSTARRTNISRISMRLRACAWRTSASIARAFMAARIAPSRRKSAFIRTVAIA
jgi:YfiH family protein